ncbi:MAG: L-cysteate sulfo-lyase [Gammaproteobacteria bacterium]
MILIARAWSFVLGGAYIAPMKNLDRFARSPLAHLPTVLEPLPGVSGWLGGPEIWVKRDDQTGVGGGGNKMRKLEFLLGHALAQGADTILTAGGVQSNHVRQTAAAASRLGLRCMAVLEEPAQQMSPEFYRSGNLMLDTLFGAQLRRVAPGSDINAALGRWSDELAAEGGRPYIVPVGGSNPVGALGYVNCAFELCEQINAWPSPPAAIVLATGSAGTQAGLLVGLHLAQIDIPVIGVCVSRTSAVQDEKVSALAMATLEHLGAVGSPPNLAVLTHDGEVGPGYGLPTEGMREAVREVARRDALLLDPVYTGKAFAGLVALVRAQHFHCGERVVFLHSGGAHALFAYPNLA